MSRFVLATLAALYLFACSEEVPISDQLKKSFRARALLSVDRAQVMRECIERKTPVLQLEDYIQCYGLPNSVHQIGDLEVWLFEFWGERAENVSGYGIMVKIDAETREVRSEKTVHYN